MYFYCFLTVLRMEIDGDKEENVVVWYVVCCDVLHINA